MKMLLKEVSQKDQVRRMKWCYRKFSTSIRW